MHHLAIVSWGNGLWLFNNLACCDVHGNDDGFSIPFCAYIPYSRHFRWALGPRAFRSFSANVVGSLLLVVYSNAITFNLLFIFVHSLGGGR